MKTYALVTVASLALSLPLSLAAQTEDEHAGHHPEGAAATPSAQAPTAPAPTAEGQAAAPAQAAAAEPQAGTAPPQAPATQAMPLQTLTQQMRMQIEKLRQTTDPAERQRLLQEHLQTMQDVVRVLDGMMEAQAAAATPQMGMMGQGMMGGGMMGQGMMGRGMMGGGGMGGCMMPGMMDDDDQKGMMGGGMRGRGMMGGSGMMRGMMMQRHMMMEQQMQSVVNRLNLMEKRLNGMQTLLDQVLQHMAATQGQG